MEETSKSVKSSTVYGRVGARLKSPPITYRLTLRRVAINNNMGSKKL